MKDCKLRIGRIPYANLFPIFYILEKEFDCSAYELVAGVPSRVNAMLREGMIDVSPSSSIEYLRNPAQYRLIEGHSISSKGPVGSIFLFSARPIEDLGGATVSVTSQSETSIALLDVILRKFYGAECALQVAENPETAGGEAFLLIGDDALKYRQASSVERQASKDKNNNSLDARRTTLGALRAYDLGDIWYRHTGLPFVFALWIAGSDFGGRDDCRRELLDAFIRDLDRAKVIALQRLPEIARRAPMRAFMSEAEIIDYWGKLDYELTAEHKKGLELFDRYLKEINYFART